MSTQLEENYAKGDWLVRNKFTDQTHSIHTTPAKATAKMHDLNSKDLEQKLNSGKDNGHTYESPYHAVLASHHYSKAQNPYHNTKTNESVEILDEGRKPSPVAGTRKIASYSNDDGHTAEVRYDPDFGEYQIHHYINGKHKAIEHASDKAEAHSTAKTSITIPNYCGSGHCHNESVVEMFESIISGELNESKNITSSILVSKIAQKLEERKIEVAQSFINPVI